MKNPTTTMGLSKYERKRLRDELAERDFLTKLRHMIEKDLPCSVGSWTPSGHALTVKDKAKFMAFVNNYKHLPKWDTVRRRMSVYGFSRTPHPYIKAFTIYYSPNFSRRYPFKYIKPRIKPRKTKQIEIKIKKEKKPHEITTLSMPVPMIKVLSHTQPDKIKAVSKRVKSILMEQQRREEEQFLDDIQFLTEAESIKIFDGGKIRNLHGFDDNYLDAILDACQTNSDTYKREAEGKYVEKQLSKMFDEHNAKWQIFPDKPHTTGFISR